MDSKPLLEDVDFSSDRARYGSVQKNGDEHYATAAFTKQRWRSIRVLYMVMFFNSVAFSIVAVSLYPYLQSLDESATVAFLGWANTGFSFSQAVGSLMFGAWCVYRPAVEPLVVSSFTFAAGSLLYSYAPAFNGYGTDVVLVSRIVLGFSTGAISVCRTVGAQMSTVKERTQVMGNLAAAQAIGFLFGPAIQACLQPIGETGIYFSPLRLRVDVYTSVGYVSILMATGMLISLACFFKELKVDMYEDSTDEIGEKDLDESLIALVPVDRIALGVLVVLFFIILFVFAVAETILSPLLMDEFAWTHDKVLLDGSLIMAGCALASIIVFIFSGALGKIFGERKLLLVGFIVLIAGYFIYLPWGNEYPDLQYTDLNNGTIVNNHANEIPPGCPVAYKWCQTTPKLYFGQFMAAALISSIGYSGSIVMAGAAYSKILGPKKQGLAMGIISASGSLARTLGPLLLSFLYTDYGPRWTYVAVLALLVLGFIIVIASYKRLVPYRVYASQKVLSAMA